MNIKSKSLSLRTQFEDYSSSNYELKAIPVRRPPRPYHHVQDSEPDHEDSNDAWLGGLVEEVTEEVAEVGGVADEEDGDGDERGADQDELWSLAESPFPAAKRTWCMGSNNLSRVTKATSISRLTAHSKPELVNLQGLFIPPPPTSATSSATPSTGPLSHAPSPSSWSGSESWTWWWGWGGRRAGGRRRRRRWRWRMEWNQCRRSCQGTWSDWWGLAGGTNPYLVLLSDLLLIPISHYLLAFLAISAVFVYRFLEFHFLHDLLTGFRGCSVALTYHSSSLIYHDVVSKCRVLHSRYMVTPWPSSPHLQTVFLSISGRAPPFNYRRELFYLSDGGTIALDWLMNSDVLGSNIDRTSAIPEYNITPIVLAIPGLTSDSESPYIKHLAFNTAQKGWNVVVTNHRGLGGVSITSDCFYNAGWTEDLRAVINHLHHEYPKAPLYVVGTSIGANILVKYLGEDGDSVPVAGAVAICSPWDLLVEKYPTVAFTTGTCFKVICYVVK
ncbi:hypothetical protein ACLB2K_013254 [Fragaria x ananassa]